MSPKQIARTITAGLAFAHGALLIAAPWWLIGPATEANSLLFAEDFDRSGIVPTWSNLWIYVDRNSLFAEFVFLSFGVALIAASVRVARRTHLPVKAFFIAVAASTVLTLSATAMFLPLYQAIAHSSSTWPPEAPAFSIVESVAITMRISFLNVAASILLGAFTFGFRHRLKFP